MRVLLAGATGLVGRHVLQLLLADARCSAVVAPVRRVLDVDAPKLRAPSIDFDAMPGGAEWWEVDAAICALGTTMKQAGSEDAFRRVDHDYPLAIARNVLRGGASVFVLNSAVGADPESRFFYNRVKGEVERDLVALGFPSLTVVRPGLIGGKRGEFRPGERAASLALGAFGPLLPRRWRINPASRIATAMVEAVMQPRPGVHVIGSDALVAS